VRALRRLDQGLDGDQGLSTTDTLGRRTSRLLSSRPRLRLGLLLGAPAAWLLVAYLGSLAALFVTSLYHIDDAGLVQEQLSLTNFRELFTEPVYRTIALRTVGVAAAVTVIDAVLALPISFYLAKVARPSLRNVLVAAVLVPLWASYLVKAYAWRAILGDPGGVLDSTFGSTPGYGLTAVVLVLAYLWLPYMVLPIYSGFERLPDSLLEASGDLGAHFATTFRRVVLPVVAPSIIAGSIFTFSLSLGDYIAVDLVGGKTQMIGTVVYANFSTNLPLAAAFAIVPVLIMVVYLVAIRRTGAMENL
jgi:putative spermidine/putrescine transport system permease protein